MTGKKSEGEFLSGPESFDPNLILPLPDPSIDERDKAYGVCMVTDEIDLQVLYSAYMQGIFPWFNEDDGDPVIWCSPDPRFCLWTGDLHISRSIDRFLKKTPYSYTMDKDFDAVINACREMDRPDQLGTWIGDKIIRAYCGLHEAGFAHSFEVWHDGHLVGGFYGVLLGSVFCGESMFTLESDSSKSAFALFARAFKKCGGKLIDCQAYTDNMARYGAVEISRSSFRSLEIKYLNIPLSKDLREQFEEDVKSFPASD